MLTTEVKHLQMGVENYHVTGLVGEGSFGKVYKGRRKFTGQTVAMKFILKHGKSEKDIESLRQEIQILKRLKHENVIQMLDFSESPQELCVVTEFAHGELFEVIEDDKCLPEEEVQKIAKQLVRALHYLHTNRIIHRDMKPQNILICAGGAVKLCDFGFARAMSANTVALRSIKGTPLYMAPELIREQAYNHTADLWSLGVILYELFVGQPPFYTERIYELIQRITKAPVKYPDTMSGHFRSFLTGLLNKDPQSRLTWPNLLEHPFVAETVEDVETRDLSANTAAARDCDAASPEGCQLLDKLESDSCTAEGAKSIIQDNELLSAVLLPLKNHLCRDEDVVTSKQSLRILLNLVAASAICATGELDEIFGELLCFTANLARMKSADYNDLLIKCFSLIKMLLDKCGGGFGDSSYMRHWVAIVELYKEVSGCTEDTYERLLYESIACISVITSRVAQGLKDAQEVAATPLMNAFKEILDPNVIRRVLKSSSPREVILDTLRIVSDLARIDDVFYMHISRADILQVLKEFLTHEDPIVRAMTCSAIGNMCRHSSYFYGSLEKHNMIRVLVDRCSDQDKHTRYFACFAIGNAAYHNDMLYEELRRCIPQLANLLLSGEEDKTRANACGALSNLVRNSNILCEDIVSKGALQALLKLVAACNNKDSINESQPLKVALYALWMMCAHSPCRRFIRSSNLYPVIGQLCHSQEAVIAKYASVISIKTREP